MPRLVQVHNLSKPLLAPATVLFCDSFACRLRGLMFRRSLSPETGLLLAHKADSRLDAAIHMLFVPFELAVFWIDSQLRVVDKVRARPWRPAYLPAARASYTLEIHATRLDDYKVDDQIEFKHV